MKKLLLVLLAAATIDAASTLVYYPVRAYGPNGAVSETHDGKTWVVVYPRRK